MRCNHFPKHTAGFHSKFLFGYGANSACGNFTSGENPERKNRIDYLKRTLLTRLLY